MDTCVDVPRAPAHLVEASGLPAVLRDGTTGDGVEADVGQLRAVVDPGLAAFVGGNDPRRTIGQRGRDAADEHVRRLDDVVVDRDHRVLPRPSFRLGQERRLCALAGDGEVGGLDLIQVDHGASLLCDVRARR